MTPDQNHYEVLGVSEDASASEIEKAFYQKVREHPPEQDQEGHERVRKAYDVLSNPVSRREYDNLAAHGEKIEQLKGEAERILNQENPDFEKAIKKLKKAVVLGPEIGLLRNYLGQAYLQNGSPEDALQQFDKAVELDETNTSHRLNRGHALERLDGLAEAERTFRSVWEEDEGDYAAARALAGVLFHQEKVEEAHEVLDTAIWADDKLDFEDFFCYHDKLQFYVAQGKTEILEEELETVKCLPETEDDRKYAAFMLAQTGQMLIEANVYRLAQEFVDAAVQLDPENPRFRAAQEFVRENAQIEQSFEEIAESSSIHEFVKHVVAVFYQRYLGIIDEEEFSERSDEIDAGLQNVMGVDPDNTEIKDSVRHIRDEYPGVFQLNESAFEAILSMPEASDRVDDCPYCGEPIRFEKGQTGIRTCGNCNDEIEVSDSRIKTPEEREHPAGENDIVSGVVNGHADMVKKICNGGYDPNFPVNDRGTTPLNLAAVNGHVEVVKVLLEAGADPKKTNDTDMSPLHFAVTEGHAEVAEVLLEAGANTTRKVNHIYTSPLHRAASEGHVEVMEVLLEAGASLTETDETGMSPLHLAAFTGHVEVAEILLDAGADLKRTDDDRKSPLHWAATSDQDCAEMAKMLVSAGANPNRRSENGYTALHIASLKGNRETTKVLLEAGANPEQKNKLLQTPLDIAERENHEAIARLLQQHRSACFVATVAYGRSDHRSVSKLRTFRDEVLRRWAIGRAFIRAYYYFGPSAAKYLDERPRFKRWVRYLIKLFVHRLPG